MTKILRADDIVWYNCADGSWGGCESDDLVIVRLADMTEDERALLDEADEYHRSPREAIVGAYERIESYKRHHFDLPSRLNNVHCVIQELENAKTDLPMFDYQYLYGAIEEARDILGNGVAS